MESLTELRVRYAETDAMGIVHHGAPSARLAEREESAGRCPIGG
jgi:acyl-CoA thioesterase FadM